MTKAKTKKIRKPYPKRFVELDRVLTDFYMGRITKKGVDFLVALRIKDLQREYDSYVEQFESEDNVQYFNPAP